MRLNGDCTNTIQPLFTLDWKIGDIPPAEIYDINQLEAMQLVDAAWKSVDASTIKHCWQKAGILPDTLLTPVVSDPITDMEKQVEESLDDLQGTGVLQSRNHMDIESLLNPEIENMDIEETMDKDIFNVVMALRSADESIDENRGDVDADDDSFHLGRSHS
ncbi:hypothetical protein EDD85DRAFT_947558 [Armillaria nabsnona]|nr:hypothetical protein EDD85DRAFT_947558 [Armillaria nabsnona]